jgi:hypothetical protein
MQPITESNALAALGIAVITAMLLSLGLLLTLQPRPTRAFNVSLEQIGVEANTSISPEELNERLPLLTPIMMCGYSSSRFDSMNSSEARLWLVVVTALFGLTTALCISHKRSYRKAVHRFIEKYDFRA